MKVALCIPVYSDTVKTRFADSLAGLLLHIGRTPFDGELMEVERFIEPSLLPLSRDRASFRALEWGAEWVLWLDADHTFPPDTLHRLLGHGKKLVGANYRRRTLPGGAAVKMIDGEYRNYESTADMAAIEPVYLLGLGLVLMAAEVIRAVADFNKGPPFLFERDSQGNHIGEDYPFIHKAGRLGYECYVDNRLSMEVGHLSEVELKF